MDSIKKLTQPPCAAVIIAPVPTSVADTLSARRNKSDARVPSPLSVVVRDESDATEARLIEVLRERTSKQTAQWEAANNAAQAVAAERRKFEQLTEPECRDALREAIEEHDAAVSAYEQAERNVARAKQRIHDADAELLDYADLDDDITKFNIEQIKLDQHCPLPDVLEQARRKRGHVVDRIHACHKTSAALVAEARAAEQQLGHVVRRRLVCATQVALRHADSMAAELEALESRRDALRKKLTTYAATWISGPGSPSSLIGLSVRARETLMQSREEPQPDAAYGTALRDLVNRLMMDADASLASDR